MKAERVLAVFAHPDDESVLAGGVLAAAAAAGADVTVVCATSGESGSLASGIGAKQEELAEIREAELRAACAELGVRTVECLGLPDGSLEDAAEQLASEVAGLLERVHPDAVVTFGPEGLYWHQDHVAVHDAVATALEGASRRPAIHRLVWPHGWMSDLVAEMRGRGLAPSLWGLDPQSWGSDPDAKTLALDVRAHLDAKLLAIGCHASQLPPDHLFRIVPRDLAETYLGREHVLASSDGALVGEAA
ncbi:MAG TPA: PIG-L deacetylase family protein [Gaiellaceae bacterium]|nr:PIG-L deacetylase family protein [Gaiellaceae bacterium]